MKFTFSIIISFLLAFILLFTSCGNGESSENSSSSNDESTAVTENEENEVISSALNLMKTAEEYEAPETMFKHFTGDFEISGFSGNSAFSGIPQSVKRKEDVTYIPTSGLNFYGVEAAGFVFYAVDSRGQAMFSNAVQLSDDIPDKSTVFTVFGIDTSVIYGADDESKSTKLTSDMLTLNDDGKSCTFAKSYINGIARDICSSMGFTDEQTKTFLRKYEGVGTYSLEDNKITFEISLDESTLGKIKQTTSFSKSDDGKITSYTFMEYSNPSLGITEPVTSEITYKDITYKDNKPISGIITLKSEKDASYYDGVYQDKVYIKCIQKDDMTFQLDVSDESAPKASVSYKKISNESYQNERYTTSDEFNVTINSGKRTPAFTFTQKSNGNVDVSLSADKIKFGTPSSFPAVPQRVTDTITNYILEEL